MYRKRLFIAMANYLILQLTASAVFADDQSQPSDSDSQKTQVDNGGLISAYTKARAKRDPNQEKYGAIAPNMKRLDVSMKEAQDLLSNTELTYFQSKYAALKDNAAIETSSMGIASRSYVEPMKSLENELSNSMEQARQTNIQNRQKLDNALAHLHSTFSDRKNSLSKSDQGRLADMISDVEARAASITSSNGTANRLSSLSEEVANLESTIVGREIFGSNTSKSASTPRLSSSSITEESKKPDNKDSKEDDSEWKTNAKAQLGPMPEETKPDLSQMIEQVEKEIQQFTVSGALGTFDQDEFAKRIKIARQNFDAHNFDGHKSGNSKLHNQQEAAMRKELEQLKKELAERVSGR